MSEMLTFREDDETIKKIDELIKKRSWEGGILEVLVRRYLEDGEW